MLNLDMKKLDRICFVIILSVSLGCSYWVMSQGIRKKRQIRQENEIISKKLADLNMAKANLARLQSILNKTKRELEALNERVPESANIGDVLKQTDLLMKKRKI